MITSPVGKEGFVSIDGKRTYLNLFGDSTDSHDVAPTKVGAVGPSTNAITGTGYAVAEQEKPKPHGVVKPTTHRRPVFGRRPSQPPVRCVLLCRKSSIKKKVDGLKFIIYSFEY